MMKKLNPTQLGFSMSIASFFIYFLVVVISLVSQEAFVYIMSNLIHGFDFTPLIVNHEHFLSNDLIGIFTVTSISFLFGWLTASVYNHVLKEE